MKTNWLRKSIRAIVVLLTALLLSATFAAAQPVKIIQEANQSDPPQSFKVKIVVDDEGRAVGAVIPLVDPTDIVLNSSMIQQQSDGSVVGLFKTELWSSLDHGGQAFSKLTVELRGSASGGGGDISDLLFDIVDSAVPSSQDGCDYPPCTDGIDIILWDIIDGVVDSGSDLLELRLSPASSTEQLTCEPTHLCNTPSSGQDLIASFPWPTPGEMVAEELTVYSTAWSEPRVVQVRLKYLYLP